MRQDSNITEETSAKPAECPIKGPRWLKYASAATFLFFLLKGLAWIGVAILAAWGLF